MQTMFHNLVWQWNVQETGAMRSSVRTHTHKHHCLCLDVQRIQRNLFPGAWCMTQGALQFLAFSFPPHRLPGNRPAKAKMKVVSLSPEDSGAGVARGNLDVNACLPLKCAQHFVTCKLIFFMCLGLVWSEGSV